MKTSTRARTAALLAAASFTALATAAPAMTGSSSAADSTSNSTSASVHSPSSPAVRDAKSVLNDRLIKCKAMRGDEKRACQKDAHADAAAVRRSAESAQGTTKAH